MLQVCLLASASATRFLSRISSRSGEERSGLKGTNMGAREEVPFLGLGDASLGCGACTRPGVGVDACDDMPGTAGEGCGCGYCDGAVGGGSSPDVFVKGCTARGSNDARTEVEDIIGTVGWVLVVVVLVVGGGEGMRELLGANICVPRALCRGSGTVQDETSGMGRSRWRVAKLVCC